MNTEKGITAGTATSKIVNAGAIAGYMYTSVIDNCRLISDITVKVSTGNVIAGGIVGSAAGGMSATSVVKNSGVTGNVTVTGADAVSAGGIAGYVNYSTVQNCYTTNAVAATKTDSTDFGIAVGGIAGKAEAATSKYANILNSYALGDITLDNKSTRNTSNTASLSQLGGIVGLSVQATNIFNCYTTGTLSATTITTKGLFVGGIAGDATVATVVRYCYATGNITATVTGTGDIYVAGIAGRIQNGAAVADCVTQSSSISITGLVVYYGRIVGLSTSSTLQDNYAYDALSIRNTGINQPVTPIGAGEKNGASLTLTQIQSQSTYNGGSLPALLSWNFSGATPDWKWNALINKPVLSWQP